MRYGRDDQSPFDTDNRAWRRLLALANEHFETLTWQRDDGRPVIITLADLTSGDMISLAVMDSTEMREPHVLLALHTDGRLTTHGPASGATTTDTYAAHLAKTDPTIVATIGVPLHDPAQPTLPDAAWRPLPGDLAENRPPVTADTRTLAVVLLDHTGDRLAIVGPFTGAATAAAWRPADPSDQPVDRLAVPLHPLTPDRP